MKSDIDIDVADRKKILDFFPHKDVVINGKKHTTGVYFQNCQNGFKIDLLNVNLYKQIDSNIELRKLINEEPDWNLLKDEEVVSKLFHLGKYFNLVKKYELRSVEDVAIILALIRPAKKHLQNYSWDVIKEEIWVKPTNNEYWFKKSHGLAYALIIVLQLNLIAKQKL